jgi:hypothetical protein
MFKTTLVVAGLLAALASAGALAATSSGGTSAKCHRAAGGFPGKCVDPIGDVKGGPGPDIARVTVFEWGLIGFEVKFAKGFGLTHTAAFTDKVSAILTATSHSAIGSLTRRYRLTVTARNLTREVLRRLPNGKPVILSVPANEQRSGRSVTPDVDLHAIGSPSIVRCRVAAVRVMRNGTWGSIDYSPNKDTMVWSS